MMSVVLHIKKEYDNRNLFKVGSVLQAMQENSPCNMYKQKKAHSFFYIFSFFISQLIFYFIVYAMHTSCAYIQQYEEKEEAGVQQEFMHV